MRQQRLLQVELHGDSVATCFTERVPNRTGSESLSVAGLFAGIGGVELGLHDAGHRPELLCEIWDSAQEVLAHRFPGVPLHDDIRSLRRIPKVDLITAGFPCTDLSQAGRTAGINGEQSGLVAEVFRLLRSAKPTWLLLENVRNMLPLDGGRAMRYLIEELEALDYRWAYRVVDSRFAGVPQRRHRVLMLASRSEDPCSVLLADDAGNPPDEQWRGDAYGFYWTEGLRGLGWAQDATPPLKGGSTIGIPSPPAVWLPWEDTGRKIVVPRLEHAEQLQGFPVDWTIAAGGGDRGRGPRWKLVGNAVTVGVARWLGARLSEPGSYDGSSDRALALGDRWPNAAWGGKGQAWASDASCWPRQEPYSHLTDIIAPAEAVPLSHKASAGFLGRTSRAKLRFSEDFLLDVKEHVAFTAG